MANVIPRFLGHVDDGAKNQLWAATALKQEVRKGYYFTPVGSRSNGLFLVATRKQMEGLWEYTEAQLKKHGY